MYTNMVRYGAYGLCFKGVDSSTLRQQSDKNLAFIQAFLTNDLPLERRKRNLQELVDTLPDTSLFSLAARLPPQDIEGVSLLSALSGEIPMVTVALTNGSALYQNLDDGSLHDYVSTDGGLTSLSGKRIEIGDEWIIADETLYEIIEKVEATNGTLYVAYDTSQ